MMTSKYRGRRTAAARNVRRHAAGNEGRSWRRNSRSASAGALRGAVRLVICGLVFSGLVAVKLFLPEHMEKVDQTLSRLLERNIDVQEVFYAVGRTFSGEGEAAEIYQAVFQTAEELPADGENGGTIGPDAWEELHCYGPRPAAEEEVSDTQQMAALAMIQYSDKNMPENVSLQQDPLGFSYCAPVAGTLSSGFGYREHPVEETKRFHYGVDLAAEAGTPVVSFADGTISAVGESSSYGKYCVVMHENGYETLYAHCSRITAASGSSVREGEKIAEVGETGMATGPHLHFELHHDGIYLNPIYYVAQ